MRVHADTVLHFSKKFNLNKYRILTIGAVLGNVGFFGLPIISALLPENPEVMCYSSVYVISMNILVFTAGIYCLTGKKEYLSIRSAVFNPTMLGLAVGLPLFLTNADDWMPQLLKNGIGIFGKMTTPLCMLILGVRLANVSLKKLLSRPFVYLICAAKLILFPLFCYLAVYFLPLPESFKISMLVLSGVPCASVIMGLAGDTPQRNGACGKLRPAQHSPVLVHNTAPHPYSIIVIRLISARQRQAFIIFSRYLSYALNNIILTFLRFWGIINKIGYLRLFF